MNVNTCIKLFLDEMSGLFIFEPFYNYGINIVKMFAYLTVRKKTIKQKPLNYDEKNYFFI